MALVWSSNENWVEYAQDKYGNVTEAAEAAEQLLHIISVGQGEQDEADARNPDAEALLACMEACRAWLEKAQVAYKAATRALL